MRSPLGIIILIVIVSGARRRTTVLALQYGLGLLSERRFGLGPADRLDFGADRPALGRRFARGRQMRRPICVRHQRKTCPWRLVP